MDRYASDIEIIENLVDEDFCDLLIRKATTDNHPWFISLDAEDDNTSEMKEGTSDCGFLFTSYLENHIDYNPINQLADYALKRFFKRSKYEWYGVVVHRILWNYYNKSSDGVFHVDEPNENYQSLLLNLNTNDGGTVVDGQTFNSEAGKLVSFPSRLLHRGIGPTESPRRFAVNIILRYDYVQEKT